MAGAHAWWAFRVTQKDGFDRTEQAGEMKIFAKYIRFYT